MIGVIFDFGGEIVEVRIDGFNCLFRTKQFGAQFATIEGLKLDYKGVCREHPDLELRDDWKEQAILRFKSKLKEFKTERERMDYIINDLEKHGYVSMYEQQQGHRVKKLKGAR